MLSASAKHLTVNNVYYKAPRNFRTYIETPFEIESRELRYKKSWKPTIALRADNGPPDKVGEEFGPRRFLERYVGRANAALVTVRVLPWEQEDWIGDTLEALIAHKDYVSTYSYRDDFTRMALFRDGKEVEPIYGFSIRDAKIYEGYEHEASLPKKAGLYCYDPSAFRPGAELELRVWKNGSTDFTAIKIDEVRRESIWAQFNGWRDLQGTR
jgi:hypothetical protein